MQDVGASSNPQLQLTALTVPSSGEVARAGQLRTLAQRMLDNDAALAAAIASAGATQLVTLSVNIPAPNGTDWPAMTSGGAYLNLGALASIVALTGVSAGYGGRVRLYRSGSEANADKFRQPYATPEVEVFLDFGLDDYGSLAFIDRPQIVQLHPNNLPASVYVQFTAYSQIAQPSVSVATVLAVLATEKAIYATE